MNCLRLVGGWQRTWMETGQKGEEKDGLSVMTSLEGEETRGGTRVDPAPQGGQTFGDCCSLGGVETDSKQPSSGLGHYRP